VVGLTRQLACEYGPSGVRTNAICPGTIESPSPEDRVAPLHLENERQLLSALDETEQQALAALLRKLLHDFESRRPVPPPSGRGGRRGRRHKRPG